MAGGRESWSARPSGGRASGAGTSVFLPSLDGGGAERSLITVAAELDARGHDIELIVGEGRGALAALVPRNLAIVDLRRAHLRSVLPSLVRHLRHRRPACLISTMEHANVVAVLACGLARTRTTPVLRLANTFSVSGPSRLLDRDRLSRRLARALYRRAPFVVAVSEGVAADAVTSVGVPPPSIRVIPNPVVGPDLFEQRDEEVEHSWFTPGPPPVVLAVGRLTRQKNFVGLLDAFAEVRRRRPARLVILGEGEQRGALERHAAALGVVDDVSLPGFDPNPFRYMARAGVYVLSSDWEGLPGGLIQALACGAPVVATDCPSGPREILRDGRYGRLVPVGDVKRLADAIVDTLAEGPRPPNSEAWLIYTVEHAVDSYVGLIEEATARR